ncbi:MAG TPA: GNAT family N-acetyltransferase [Candidatus Omnitrophota bacterium]|nr:GNAT family N-acetyltransferase [Candidatus Omnitrophota bacterium]HPS20980.1 GNAT family N-acetyltransferase [Candidatus Omnitrophota bacterium]
MIIRDLDIACDDVYFVAKLIYHTDQELFPLVFGREKAALRNISALIRGEGNRYSHRNIIIAEEKGYIFGILISHGIIRDKKAERKEHASIFGFWGGVKLDVIGTLLEKFVLTSVKSEKEKYISNISVRPESRGKGIGGALIDQAVSDAAVAGYKAIFLDVSLKNLRARELYERKGFKVVKTNSVFFNTGAYSMCREIC